MVHMCHQVQRWSGKLACLYIFRFSQANVMSYFPQKVGKCQTKCHKTFLRGVAAQVVNVLKIHQCLPSYTRHVSRLNIQVSELVTIPKNICIQCMAIGPPPPVCPHPPLTLAANHDYTITRVRDSHISGTRGISLGEVGRVDFTALCTSVGEYELLRPPTGLLRLSSRPEGGALRAREPPQR